MQKAVILELVKDDERVDTNQATFIVLAHFLTAYVISIGIFILEMLLLALSVRTNVRPLPAQLFGASLESNTSNLHLQRLGNFADSDLDILILESPIKRFEKKLSDAMKVKTHWCRSIFTDLRALIGFFGNFSGLLSAVSRVSRHRRIAARQLGMTFVRLSRGISICNYLRAERVDRLVFSLSGNACTAMIELGLKGTTETIHWLHGVGLGFKFDSFSDKTLVNNEYDYKFYSDGLSGGTLFFPDTSQRFSFPIGPANISSVVVYSNLIHPSNTYFSKMGIRVESELLALISSMFCGRELVIKPHPSAFPLLGRQLGEYLRYLDQFDFRIWKDTDLFMPEESLFISTVSTTFIDLIAEGKCVFLYDKYSDQSSRFQKEVSNDLRFWDKATLERAITLLDTSTALISALQTLAVQSEAELFGYLIEYEKTPKTGKYHGCEL